jgi:hypothetical protein
LSFSLNADRAPQLKASVRLLYGDVWLKKSLEQRIEEAICEEISISPYDPG